MSIQHKDIPDAQLHQVKGAATASIGQILTATGSGTATFQTPPFSKVVLGWWYYADTATTTTPIPLTTAGTYVQLTNDGIGALSNDAYAVPGVADVWDVATGFFDFSDLAVGDVVDIRVDVSVTTGSVSNVLTTALDLGVGGTPQTIVISDRYVKTASTTDLSIQTSIAISSDNVKNNPARLKMKNDTVGSTVVVKGWFVKVIKHG